MCIGENGLTQQTHWCSCWRRLPRLALATFVWCASILLPHANRDKSVCTACGIMMRETVPLRTISEKSTHSSYIAWIILNKFQFCPFTPRLSLFLGLFVVIRPVRSDSQCCIPSETITRAKQCRSLCNRSIGELQAHSGRLTYSGRSTITCEREVDPFLWPPSIRRGPSRTLSLLTTYSTSLCALV